MIVDGSPRAEGSVGRGDLTVRYQVFGDHPRAVLLLPTWSIVHSDFWRHQVPNLAERFTVAVFDGVGNGASDRSTDPGVYDDRLFSGDALSVLDAAGIDQAATLSVSKGAGWNLVLAAEHADRIPAAVFIAPALPFGQPPAPRAASLATFHRKLRSHDGWDRFNRHYWSQHWPDFLRFFFGQCFTEPDSARQIEHFVEMGLQTSPEVVAATVDAPGLDADEAVALAAGTSIPTLVIHGSDDAISHVATGRELARLTGGEYVERPGEGHEPQSRNPDATNAVIDRFLDLHHPPGR